MAYFKDISYYLSLKSYKDQGYWDGLNGDPRSSFFLEAAKCNEFKIAYNQAYESGIRERILKEKKKVKCLVKNSLINTKSLKFA